MKNPMRRLATEPNETYAVALPSRLDELIARLIHEPDSLSQAELMELAKGVLEPLLRKRRH